MTSTLTFYGGVKEIGGNKVLLKTDDGSVLLDFGRRMGIYGDFFSEFLQVRSKNAFRDLLRLDVLPKINGIYPKNLVDTTSLFGNADDAAKLPLAEAQDYWKTSEVVPCDPNNPGVDAVFVSHAHFDHIQDLSFLDPCIPVFCTEKTRVLAKAMTDVSVSGVDDQYYKLAKKVIIEQKEGSFKTLCPGELACTEDKDEDLPVIEDPKTKFKFTYEIAPEYRKFETAPEGKIKGIKYKLVSVGHSVPGACSVLLTLPGGKRVLYTGDVRFHGAGEVSMDEYTKAVGGPVDVLITEGTRVDSDDVLTEEDVGQRINAEIAASEGLVLVNFGWKDLTRFNTVYQASIANGRTLVVSPKLAYLLYEMHCAFPDEYTDPRSTIQLAVYTKREGDLLYSKAEYEKWKLGFLHFHGRNVAQTDRNILRVAERLGLGGNPQNPKNPLPLTSKDEPYDYKELYSLATHHLDHGVRAYQIRREPSKYVLMFSYFDANELFDLIPTSGKHMTRFISASTEPFSEEMAHDEDKLIKWLDTFGITYDYTISKGKRKLVHRHVSGHASKAELVHMIQKINPAIIIVIHSERPENFEEMFPGKVIKPHFAKPIQV